MHQSNGELWRLVLLGQDEMSAGSCSLFSSFLGVLNHSFLTKGAALTSMTAKKKPRLPLGIKADWKTGFAVTGMAGTDDAQLDTDSPGHGMAP
jgi:hypothetical protein